MVRLTAAQVLLSQIRYCTSCILYINALVKRVSPETIGSDPLGVDQVHPPRNRIALRGPCRSFVSRSTLTIDSSSRFNVCSVKRRFLRPDTFQAVYRMHTTFVCAVRTSTQRTATKIGSASILPTLPGRSVSRAKVPRQSRRGPLCNDIRVAQADA